MTAVASAAVNFATRRATVRYSATLASREKLVAAVRRAGYGVTESKDQAKAEREEIGALRRKLLISALLSLPVVVLGMSHGARWPQLALTTVVLFYCGAQFFAGAWKALLRRSADMNTLVATGTGAAYAYSAVAVAAKKEATR